MLILFLTLLFAKEVTCTPQQAPKDLPKCPNGKILSENFPVKAIAMSLFPNSYQRRNEEVKNMVKRILNSSKNPPQIILSIPPRLYTEILQDIEASALSAEDKQIQRQALVTTEVVRYTWQQDYFEAFINPNTGIPELREIGGHRQGRRGMAPSLSSLTANLNACEYTTGESLMARTYHEGLDGGNIEALPGGICVVGGQGFPSDVDFHHYLDQFCDKDPNKRIKAPTDWLQIAHVDQIFKVVRNKNRKAPCDFSVALSSPRTAFQLLMENSSQKFMSPNTGNRDLDQIRGRTRYETNPALKTICEEAKKIYSPSTPTTQKGNAVSSLFILSAFAGTSTQISCSDLTNGEVMNVLSQNENFKEYNYAIQAEIDTFREEIRRKLKLQFPSCETDFIDVPDFFEPKPFENKMGKKILPKRGSSSILPNSTNSITVNDLIFSSDSGNSAFREYLKSAYTSRGLNVEFVDTMDTLHPYGGNLHCATHTIHHCSP